RDGSNPKSLLPSGAFRISVIPSREIVFPSFWPKSSLGKTVASSGFEKMYENTQKRIQLFTTLDGDIMTIHF
ncbi:MAG: hypothetical protein VX020_01485, partial [SAR324 cluster bacterium]|nr:hypothetical protein [SAR324 cluster bacterium]